MQAVVSAGLEPNTPCAVISKATSPDQQIHQTTLQDLHAAPKLPTPTLLVVGEVVRLAKQLSPISEIASFAANIPLGSFMRLQPQAQELETSE